MDVLEILIAICVMIIIAQVVKVLMIHVVFVKRILCKAMESVFVMVSTL
jgi:hypothetical protein